MSSFTKHSYHQSFSSGTAWNGRDEIGNSGQRSRSNSRPPPRGILRNSFVGEADDPSTIYAAGTSPQRTSHEDAGRQRFLSLPVQSTAEGASPSSPTRRSVNLSPSIPQMNDRARVQAYQRTSDAEADRLARACGEGPFSPTAPSPYLSTDAFTNTPAPSARQRSQSVSVAQLQRRRSSARPAVRDFPHTGVQQSIRALKRLLEEETKTFKIHDHIEVEDLLSGRLWEDEDELPVDCVRDKVDEDNGHDGVWRRERRERRLMEGVRRKMKQRDQNVFGAYIQDLPDTALVPVVVGGYRHLVPLVVQASIEELYRTGIYEHSLFRTLPDRAHLFQLVAHFDAPPTSQLSTRNSLPNLAVHISPDPRSSAAHASRASMSAIPRPVSLHAESYPELCALLITYLTSLPTPLIHRSLSSALWAWCVSPSLLRHEQRLRRRGDDASSSSSSSSEDEEEESYSTRIRRREEALLNLPPLRVQIKIARGVLLLLPRRVFGMLVYVLTFFDAVAKAPGVGMDADDVGRLIGAAVVGGQQRRESIVEGKKKEGREDKSQAVVVWLLKHWGEIASGYECEDAEGRRESNASTVSKARERSASACVSLGKSGDHETRADRSKGDAGRYDDRGRRASSSEREDGSAKSDYEARTPVEHPIAPSDSIPRIELPLAISQEKLFTTPAPFGIHSPDVDEDASVYSNDDASLYDMYSSSLLQEPLPPTALAPSKLPRVAPLQIKSRRDGKRELQNDADAASRFLLERENLELKRRLAEALGERDEAKKVVDAMRGLVKP